MTAVTLRACAVSFKDQRGIRHTAEVEAETLYEAAVFGIKRLREDPWLEPIGASTLLDVEVREPATKHSITLRQVERWLAGVTRSPRDASKRAKLKMMLLKRS